jgi:hypothetical protein
MTIPILGAILLVALVVMWRLGINGLPMIGVAILFGFVIGLAGGTASHFAHGAVDWIQSGFAAIGSVIGK